MCVAVVSVGVRTEPVEAVGAECPAEAPIRVRVVVVWAEVLEAGPEFPGGSGWSGGLGW